MLVGYARVSTVDQNAELQIDALRDAGCAKIFQESESGAKVDRPELMAALSYMREGDTLVVWKLDRLARSMKQLVDTVEDLRRRGIGFRCLTGDMDTSTPSGKLVFHMFGALAEFERELIRERTIAGLVAARARGRKGGRIKSITDLQIKKAKELYDNKVNSVSEICKIVGMSRASFYKVVRG